LVTPKKKVLNLNYFIFST